MPFVKNENEADLEKKGKGNDKSWPETEWKRYRVCKKKNGNHNDIIQGSIVVEFLNIDIFNYIFKNKNIIAEVKPNSVHQRFLMFF